MAAAPYLSVIVPAFNEVNTIERTLAAVGTYLDRQPWDYEVIVSADGTDGTRERAAEFARRDPRVIVIGTAERGGKGRGVRNGVFRATGQVIGFLDADDQLPRQRRGHRRMGQCIDFGGAIKCARDVWTTGPGTPARGLGRVAL